MQEPERLGRAQRASPAAIEETRSTQTGYDENGSGCDGIP